MTITFVGHGYVGLVTASVFADLGNTVYVIGHTKEKIDNLNKGRSPFASATVSPEKRSSVPIKDSGKSETKSVITIEHCSIFLRKFMARRTVTNQ